MIGITISISGFGLFFLLGNHILYFIVLQNFISFENIQVKSKEVAKGHCQSFLGLNYFVFGIYAIGKVHRCSSKSRIGHVVLETVVDSVTCGSVLSIFVYSNHSTAECRIMLGDSSNCCSRSFGWSSTTAHFLYS